MASWGESGILGMSAGAEMGASGTWGLRALQLFALAMWPSGGP